jgi:hypothetical protein
MAVAGARTPAAMVANSAVATRHRLQMRIEFLPVRAESGAFAPMP